MQSKTGPILIGLAYLALIVFIMVFCADRSSTFDDYSKYWGLFGTLVGVATGAIPSFFFKSQADDAKAAAKAASEQASKAGMRAELYAAASDPSQAMHVEERVANLM